MFQVLKIASPVILALGLEQQVSLWLLAQCRLTEDSYVICPLIRPSLAVNAHVLFKFCNSHRKEQVPTTLTWANGNQGEVSSHISVP